MENHNVGDTLTVSGKLSGFIVRGGDGGSAVEIFDPDKPRGPIIRKASRGWRFRNWVRKLASGELFVPLIVGAVNVCRSRFVRAVPIVGPIVAGSIGAVGLAVGELRGFVTHQDGTVTDYGVLGYHLVLTAGKNFVASAFDNTVEVETLKYHAFGTGNTAASAGDTALQTELTTQYAVSNTRPTGSQSHSSNTYITAGTLSPSATVAVQEWGLANQASNAGGTFLDRQVYTSVGLTNVDSFTVTYTLTLS